jgi:hypothetical protein
MLESPTLVRVRFTSTRGSLCGVHVSGMEYDVPRPFAELVVEREHAAEYVTPEPAVSSVAGTGPRTKRTR